MLNINIGCNKLNKYTWDSCLRYAGGGVKRKQKLKLNASATEMGNF